MEQKFHNKKMPLRFAVEKVYHTKHLQFSYQTLLPTKKKRSHVLEKFGRFLQGPERNT